MNLCDKCVYMLDKYMANFLQREYRMVKNMYIQKSTNVIETLVPLYLCEKLRFLCEFLHIWCNWMYCCADLLLYMIISVDRYAL